MRRRGKTYQSTMEAISAFSKRIVALKEVRSLFRSTKKMVDSSAAL